MNENSNYINNLLNLNIINFNNIEIETEQLLNSINFNSFPNFQNKPILQSISTFIKEFDQLLDENIINPSNIIKKFYKFLNKKIIKKNFYKIY